MMGSISIWHWLVSVFLILNVMAFWKILPRAGLPFWLAAFAIFPPAAMILLWVVGFKKWPGDTQ
jgi:hypothetical protein